MFQKIYGGIRKHKLFYAGLTGIIVGSGMFLMKDVVYPIPQKPQTVIQIQADFCKREHALWDKVDLIEKQQNPSKTQLKTLNTRLDSLENEIDSLNLCPETQLYAEESKRIPSIRRIYEKTAHASFWFSLAFLIGGTINWGKKEEPFREELKEE
tara:strand:+ start:271 stop:732 length:462 start_codon:yes stop_codon:yes gene_type:complete